MLSIPEDLKTVTSVKIEVLESPIDIYNDIARIIANTIRENNKQGRPTALIIPVGPTGQYRRLARICNLENISCRNLWTFNMDEYCSSDGKWVSFEHAMGFRGFMEREFFSRLGADLAVPERNRIFPDPENPEAIGREIDRIGGIDICFGGIGINGHIAFNEPPVENLSADEFRNLRTRVLNVSRETRVVNSIFGTKGDIGAVPPKCVTIGMKEILASRRLHFYLEWPWQSAVLRKTVLGPLTPSFPASFLRTHPDCTLTIAKCVAEIPAAEPE
jgi:glucosamine-6-phosphate deaminase